MSLIKDEINNSYWYIRESLKYLFRFIIFPILKGPIKGKKWIIGVGCKHILGTYEPIIVSVFTKHIKKDTTVYDIGAHVGYLAILASKLAGPKGQVIAFEPRPLNLTYLKKHIRINKCNNVQIIQSCVGDVNGFIRFETRSGTMSGHVSPEGNLAVKIISLDELYNTDQIPAPNFIKIDVEGGEFSVLKGAKNLIGKTLPVMLVSTHSKELFSQCFYFLNAFNYKLEIIGGEILCIPRGNSGDTILNY